MKISERIALIKAGYSKDEISEMINDERNEEVSEPAEPKTDSRYEDIITALALEVKSMKEAIQKDNIDNTVVKTENPIDKASEILASLINTPPATGKKEDK